MTARPDCALCCGQCPECARELGGDDAADLRAEIDALRAERDEAYAALRTTAEAMAASADRATNRAVKAEADLARLREALDSIAANTAPDTCDSPVCCDCSRRAPEAARRALAPAKEDDRG